MLNLSQKAFQRSEHYTCIILKLASKQKDQRPFSSPLVQQVAIKISANKLD